MAGYGVGMRQPTPPGSAPAPKTRPKRGPRLTAPRTPKGTAPDPTAGERIAKVLARAGVASRRTAETMITEGRVAVNGVTLSSPALNVMPDDRITVDGQPIAAAEAPRLWLYHKPAGLVTTTRDELGRPTVFDALPDDLPRVLSIGRLDLNSEGLLLLTNDGAIKRRLELPATGWVRKYRVRIKGVPQDAAFAQLRRGITVEGERFQPMAVTIDRQQGANAWLTLGLREGRNREIRRAMEYLGFTVNRLIRISYGPFQLGDLAPGAVEEVKARILRDQLGLPPADPARPVAAPRPAAPASPDKPGRPAKPGTPTRPGKPPRPVRPAKPGQSELTSTPTRPGKPPRPAKPGGPDLADKPARSRAPRPRGTGKPKTRG